jgi:hypothetical protein
VIFYLNSATTPASMFVLPSTEVTIDRSKDVDARDLCGTKFYLK